MAEHTIDLATFRLLFPAFANTALYSDARLTATFEMATAYLGAYDGCTLYGAVLQNALNLLTAHLLQLSTALAMGQTASGVITGATIDKVSVTLAAPPTTSGWKYWLATTPYGLQLWALLSIKAAGGGYYGGSFMRAGFRGPSGRFGGQ